MFFLNILLELLDILFYSTRKSYPFYRWLFEHFPAWGNRICFWRAWRAYARARAQVPAYTTFLASQKLHLPEDKPLEVQFAAIPETDKNAYVLVYTTAARCVGGDLPAHDVIVDESSGSTGLPYNWVRSHEEVTHSRRIVSYFNRYYFGEEPLFIINAFSMGAWTTGVTVGRALEANGIVKSTGPDLEKILHTLRFFGSAYKYQIIGYPPFLKRLLDYGEEQGLDWSQYRLVGMVGGEAMSEGLRRYLLRHFSKILSGYGASDLEVGVAGESDLTVVLRQLMEHQPRVRAALLGTEEHRTPMLFQYNPLDHYIEVNANHELLITITRRVLSPRIRYNVHDEGGVISYADMRARLLSASIELEELLPPESTWPRLPFVYVFGRRDSTISYMGANIYPEDVEAALFASQHARHLGAFALELREDECTREIRPCIHVELMEGQPDACLTQQLHQHLTRSLTVVNADFRQALSEAKPSFGLLVIVHKAGEGPFAVNESRIKRRYIVGRVGKRST